VITDRSAAVLAHGLGGSTDLPIPFTYALIAPVRTLHRLLGRRSLGLRYPEWAGYWPAAVGLFAFVWLELASPDPGSLGVIKIWLLVYLAVTLAGALCCGERWCARADPFEVYSMVASRLSDSRRSSFCLVSVAPKCTTCCQCIHRCSPASRWDVWWPDTSPL
jgi:hypothetical protein